MTMRIIDIKKATREELENYILNDWKENKDKIIKNIHTSLSHYLNSFELEEQAKGNIQTKARVKAMLNQAAEKEIELLNLVGEEELKKLREKSITDYSDCSKSGYPDSMYRSLGLLAVINSVTFFRIDKLTPIGKELFSKDLRYRIAILAMSLGDASKLARTTKSDDELKFARKRLIEMGNLAAQTLADMGISYNFKRNDDLGNLDKSEYLGWKIYGVRGLRKLKGERPRQEAEQSIRYLYNSRKFFKGIDKTEIASYEGKYGKEIQMFCNR